MEKLPDVMRADLIAAGLQVGCMALRRTDAADTWGQDIEVPEKILYFTTRLSWNVIRVGPSLAVHAANMSTPGAVMSGWKCPQVVCKFLKLE